MISDWQYALGFGCMVIILGVLFLLMNVITEPADFKPTTDDEELEMIRRFCPGKSLEEAKKLQEWIHS